MAKRKADELNGNSLLTGREKSPAPSTIHDVPHLSPPAEDSTRDETWSAEDDPDPHGREIERRVTEVRF